MLQDSCQGLYLSSTKTREVMGNPFQEIFGDPRDLDGRGKSQGREGYIFKYLPSFGGVQTFSSSLIHLQGWIRKSTPVDREALGYIVNPIKKCQEFIFRLTHKNLRGGRGSKKPPCTFSEGLIFKISFLLSKGIHGFEAGLPYLHQGTKKVWLSWNRLHCIEMKLKWLIKINVCNTWKLIDCYHFIAKTKQIISLHQLCFVSLSRDKTNIDLSYPFTHMAGICLRNILSTVADSPSLV